MKWISKRPNVRVWHKWFAWFPVTVGEILISGERRELKIWLSYVNRKLDNNGPHYGKVEVNWIYKEIHE